jgi:hypothetical protein
MGLIDFIEKLQKKPEASRRLIAIVAAFSVTAIIVFFWLATFHLPDIDEDIKNITSPFASIKEDISNFYNLLKNAAK